MGSENIGDNILYVYPNPTSGLLTVKHTADSKIPYEITDITGKLIQKGMLMEKQTNLDISKYVNGIYLLKINEQTIKLTRQ